MENVRETEKVIPLFESPEVRKQVKVSEQEEMVAVDEKMKALMKKAEQVAPSNFSVLLTGETGAGKEELAKFIHKKSGREIFVSVNCAALPENLVESELFGHKRGAFTSAVSDYRGKFLLTDNGTFFLDEIGDMNLLAQAKILQATDGNLDGKHDFYPVGGEAKVSSSFRIICASNQNLEKLVKDGKFRQDLFFRLNVISFHIPPLRERRTEIPVLAQIFLEKVRSKLGNSQLFFSAESLNFLSGLNWPGNVRQLQNLVIKAAALMGREKKVIEAKYLKELIAEYNHNAPEAISLTGEGKAFKDYKHKLYLQTLEEAGYVVSVAARKLGLNPRTLYRFVQLSGIKRDQKINEKRDNFESSLAFQDRKAMKSRSNEVLSKNKEHFSKELLISTLEQNDWSKTKMAAALKIGYQKVGALVKKLDIKPPGGIWGRKPEYTKEKLELILKENNWNQTRAAASLGITQARFSALAKNRGVVAPDGIWQRSRSRKPTVLEIILGKPRPVGDK